MAHLAIPGMFWRRIIDNLHHVRGLEPPRDVLGRVSGHSWEYNQYYPHWQIFFGTTKYFSDGQIFLWLAIQAVSGIMRLLSRVFLHRSANLSSFN